MRIRNGFVSNSSSCSFLLIKEGSKELNIKKFVSYIKETKYDWSDSLYRHIDLPLKGTTDSFTRVYETFDSFEDKINFICCQLIKAEVYLDKKVESRNTLIRMEKSFYGALNRALQEYLEDKTAYIEIRKDYNKFFFDSISEDTITIDHQSSVLEGENTEVFNTADNMYTFLFSENSKIYMGSDELEPTDEYIDGLICKYEDDKKAVDFLKKKKEYTKTGYPNDYDWEYDYSIV